jgi:23S rRNA (cytidine1920-2'-O)/16S rRNA (cytidine1409-2'-O)-methyltransferase
MKRPLAALLVERGLFSTIDESRRWVMAGQVLVDGQRVDKPGTAVAVDAALVVLARRQFASRGGLKLHAALEHWGIAVAGRVALDCGASTGGFTDCLLQHGAAQVYAVEAGYGQLLGRLRADGRVRSMERTNLGAIALGSLDPAPSLITLDLSYLSLTAALPLAAALLAPQGDVVALFKPLFEVNDAQARRTGVLAAPTQVAEAMQRVLAAGAASGLTPLAGAKLRLAPRNGVPESILWFGGGSALPAWQPDAAEFVALLAGPGIGPAQEQ